MNEEKCKGGRKGKQVRKQLRKSKFIFREKHFKLNKTILNCKALMNKLTFLNTKMIKKTVSVGERYKFILFHFHYNFN